MSKFKARYSASKIKVPTVKVRLTPEEKSAIPDWQERVAVFQRTCDEDLQKKRERFRVCLHEAAHAIQYQQFGWDVEFLGPYVGCKDGRLRFVIGAVSPVRLSDYKPLPWQRAMVSIAGFKFVEHFTGLPDDEVTIQGDLTSLRSDLGEDADVNGAVWKAELMLEDQLCQPGFLDELREMVCAYEFIVYNTKEATTWGWKEYRPELPGERHRVIVATSGGFGTLVEHEGELKLVVEGEVLRSGEKLRGLMPEVRIAEPEDAGADRAVRCWNEVVA